MPSRRRRSSPSTSRRGSGAGGAPGRRGAGVGRGLLLRPDRQPRRHDARVAAVEPPEHAVGRHRVVDRGASSADGALGARQKVAGGADESIFQPEWSPDGMLYFVSDRTGWWNLYRAGGRRHRAAASDARRSSASRSGRFSMVTYAFMPAEPARRHVYAQDGRWKLALHRDRSACASSRCMSSLEPIESHSRRRARDLLRRRLADRAASRSRA